MFVARLSPSTVSLPECKLLQNDDMSTTGTTSIATLAPEPRESEFVEPLLMDPESKTKQYTFFPIPASQQAIYEYYKLHRSTFWSTEELDLTGDRDDFRKLDKKEQHFLKMTLAFFASSDVIVADNLANNFINDCPWRMVQLFYDFQTTMENIHSETYGLLIEELIVDPKDKAVLFDAINQVPCVKQKAAWVLQYMDRDRIPYVERLVAFAFFEGVAFASSFASIFFMREKHPGLLKGLVFSNELISRDESLHAEFAVHLFNNHINSRPSTERMHEIVQSLLDVERNFVRNALPTSLIGLSPASMIKYVEFTSDQLLQRMNYPPLYKHTKCPLQVMTSISVATKTNFFEARNASYSLPDAGCQEFVESDDF